jgi:subtilisin family serine protease
MKTVLLYAFMLIIIIGRINAQDTYYYYYGDKKVSLQPSLDKVLIKFNKELSFESIKEFISLNSKIKPISVKNIHRSNFVTAELIENLKFNDLKQLIIALNSDEKVDYANLYYRSSNDYKKTLTDKFIVKLEKTTSIIELEALLNNTKTSVFRQDKYDNLIYVINVDKKSTGNALELANYFYETGKFVFSEPDFLSTVRLFTNDEYYSQQWALNNTGQTGGASDADMDIPEAWAITTGKPSIKIAVIDNGTELNHPDLNLLTGYDATGGGTYGGPVDGSAFHGTATAGIIGAKGNNTIGVAGVAYDCSIIPISIDLSGLGFSALESADAINWAWDDGQADVLSNSWGGMDESAYINTAISNAVTLGRGGLGSVVLFATGNDNTVVSWPASNPNVIAVGATTNVDSRASYSNYGTGLDVVAPGSGIYTTDISGSGGYEAGNYTSNFTGTSAACPNAAGVVGLILSVNRCLSGADVRKILELSCDKVGQYCYTPGYTNGSWNNEMGYGRINAFNAVRYAFSSEINTYNISGYTNYVAHNDYEQMLIISGGCLNLGSGTYYVNFYELTKNISFPNTPNPYIFGTASGLSLANPNLGNRYMEISSITQTSATLKTYIWEAYDINHNFVGWFPVQPYQVTWNYSVLSNLAVDSYFQNQTISTTQTHNSMNTIEAGRNVTNTVSVGDYTLANGANVTFHAGNEVLLADGTNIETGSQFYAYVDPFFTCTQYPMGIIVNSGNSNYPPVVKEYLVTWEGETNLINDSEYEIKNFPNPFSNSTTIEYRIKDSQSVRISISDKSGLELFVLQNRKMHEAGTYKISFEGFNIPSGVYFCTIEADTFKETKRMVKIQ